MLIGLLLVLGGGCVLGGGLVWSSWICCWYCVVDVFWVVGWSGVERSVAGTVWWMCSGWWVGLVLIGLLLVLCGGCVLGGGFVWSGGGCVLGCGLVRC